MKLTKNSKVVPGSHWPLNIIIIGSLSFLLLTLPSCTGGSSNEVAQEQSSEVENRRASPQFKTFGEASEWYQSQDDLDWISPDSTSIHKAAYHKGDMVLLIFFKSNKTLGYVYGGVPNSLWEEFKNADSKGSFFHFHIKGAYKYNLEGDLNDKK